MSGRTASAYLSEADDFDLLGHESLLADDLDVDLTLVLQPREFASFLVVQVSGHIVGDRDGHAHNV